MIEGAAITKTLLALARCAGLAAGAILAGIGIYLLTALVLGLIPSGPPPAVVSQGILIFVASNGVHTDLLVPIQSAARDWRKRLPELRANRAAGAPAYLAIGWGDRDFYLETPGWRDLRFRTAVRALAGLDRTVMHVEPIGVPLASDQVRALTLSPTQFARLIDYIDASFERDASGQVRAIAGAHYDEFDTFYEATGHYSLVTTCNEWVRLGLAHADVRVPLWSPFTLALLHHIPSAP